MLTPPHVEAARDEAPPFVDLLNAVIRGHVRRHSPLKLWIIKIDNWFDHKWLQFSGIGIVDFQFPTFMKRDDGALDEFFQDGVTFPPFTPNRVLSQTSYVREKDNYFEAPTTPLPHPTERRRTQTNLQRRISRSSRSAAYFWYSSKTLSNGRASVMVYSVSKDQIDCWYASFRCRSSWQLQSVKGVSREEVEHLLHMESSR